MNSASVFDVGKISEAVLTHFGSSFSNRLKLELPVAGVVVCDEFERNEVVYVCATADSENARNTGPVATSPAIPDPEEHGTQLVTVIAVLVVVHGHFAIDLLTPLYALEYPRL